LSSIKYFNGIYDSNERVVLEYDVNGKLLLIILVGAKMVNSISYNDEKKIYIKGDEIGKFNFGSTVIMLFDSNFNIPLIDNKKVIMEKNLF
jgi:phosphatidylserine decarboxylase